MNKIKQLRIDRGWSQTQLAKALKIKQASISQAERKGIAKITTARKYAAVLKCDPLDLLD